MDFLAAQQFDDLLPDAAQAHAIFGQLGMLGDDTEDIALARIGIHPHQKVGAGKVKEREGVALHELGVVEHAAQLYAGFGHAHGQQFIAGLGGGEQMRNRADAADARGDGGHLVERPAFAELFKAADLGDVEARVSDVALVIKLDGNAAVAFHARDGVDGDRPAGDGRAHGGSGCISGRNSGCCLTHG